MTGRLIATHSPCANRGIAESESILSPRLSSLSSITSPTPAQDDTQTPSFSPPYFVDKSVSPGRASELRIRSDETPSPTPSSGQEPLRAANAPGPASRRLKSTKSGVRARPPKTPQDPTIDIKPLLAEQRPNEPNEEATSFRTALYEYGKAIIESAMDHDPESISSLEHNMVTTKVKVIGSYEEIAKELDRFKADLTKEKDRNEQLHRKLVKEAGEKSDIESDLIDERERTITLKKELAAALREKEEYKTLSQKALLDLC